RVCGLSYRPSAFRAEEPPNLSDFHVFEIIPGRNSLRLAEGGIIEVGPGDSLSAVRHRDRDRRPNVEAAIRVVGPKTLDLVQDGENRSRIGHLVNFPPHASVGRCARRRNKAQYQASTPEQTT